MATANTTNTAKTANYTVTVVRNSDHGEKSLWCAAVLGVKDAVAWGSDFSELEDGVRARLTELVPGVEPELTWEIDAQDDAGRQVPLSPM